MAIPSRIFSPKSEVTADPPGVSPQLGMSISSRPVRVRLRALFLIDDDLHESVFVRLYEHLVRCGSCHSFIQSLKATVGLFRAAPQKKGTGGLC